MQKLTVPYRFRGPAGSANGGYLGGRAAALRLLPAAARTVWLTVPRSALGRAA
jgi:hypothetical protein